MAGYGAAPLGSAYFFDFRFSKRVLYEQVSYGDPDVVEKTVWNDWFFGPTVTFVPRYNPVTFDIIRRSWDAKYIPIVFAKRKTISEVAINAVVSSALQDATIQATAIAIVLAQVNKTLQDAAVLSTGNAVVSAAVNKALDNIVTAIAGNSSVSISVIKTLQDAVSSGTVSIGINALLNKAIADVTSIITGHVGDISPIADERVVFASFEDRLISLVPELERIVIAEDDRIISVQAEANRNVSVVSENRIIAADESARIIEP